MCARVRAECAHRILISNRIIFIILSMANGSSIDWRPHLIKRKSLVRISHSLSPWGELLIKKKKKVYNQHTNQYQSLCYSRQRVKVYRILHHNLCLVLIPVISSLKVST